MTAAAQKVAAKETAIRISEIFGPGTYTTDIIDFIRKKVGIERSACN